jgi:hypothetical protein
MKWLLRAVLLALPFLAMPTHAHGWHWINQICNGCGGWNCCGYGPTSLCPWYTYYPYDAHFMTPAHPEFPYWPRTMVPIYNTPAPAPTNMPILPTGYYQPEVYPSYWYGH